MSNMVHIEIDREIWKKLKAYEQIVDLNEDESLKHDEAIEKLIDNSDYSDKIKSLVEED